MRKSLISILFCLLSFSLQAQENQLCSMVNAIVSYFHNYDDLNDEQCYMNYEKRNRHHFHNPDILSLSCEFEVDSIVPFEDIIKYNPIPIANDSILEWRILSYDLMMDEVWNWDHMIVLYAISDLYLLDGDMSVCQIRREYGRYYLVFDFYFCKVNEEWRIDNVLCFSL